MQWKVLIRLYACKLLTTIIQLVHTHDFYIILCIYVHIQWLYVCIYINVYIYTKKIKDLKIGIGIEKSNETRLKMVV